MIIDGKSIAERLYVELRQRISKLPFTPVVCDMLVGNDPVQEKFVRVKQRRAEEIGLRFETVHFPFDATTEDIIRRIAVQGVVPGLCGIIVQLPLPGSMDLEAVLESLPAAYDIDCLKTVSGVQEFPEFTPPTAGAVVRILDSLNIDLSGKTYVVVGQGRLVGVPVTQLLKARGYTVVTIDINTADAAKFLTAADVIISGVGKQGLIRPEHVRAGAIVIDAGTSESGGAVKGDVAPEVVEKASHFTPVPGGVGPVTVAVLLQNAVAAAERIVSES